MLDEKKLRMQQLIQELNEASDAYYNGQQEQMTDFEWDARFDELRQLETETGVTLPHSPTQHVSEDNVAGQKEEHEFAALSLAKTKQPLELVKWAEGRPIWMSWKLDGLTLVATYDNGTLTKLVTRGNGHIGTNITHLSKAINGIPQKINYQGHTIIRGEAVISYDDFERFLIESGGDYANPRNLASGSLTLKDTEEVHQRHIRWMPFTLVYLDDNINSWGERMNWLDRQGFDTVERLSIINPTVDAVEAAISDFTVRVTSKQNPYPVDGLVICYDDISYASTGSITGHHATRAGLAFKWADEFAETTLNEIEWSCAASTISPVAIFQPVELEGTTVQRASLCNISECERLGIGGKGTKLRVIKANKIIPKVIEVTASYGPFIIPDRCPVCHAPAAISVSEGSGTKTLHCTNTDCPAKQLKKFVRLVSKDGLNIDGISEQTLSKFINWGWISEYADLYMLRRHIRELAQAEGFGERSAANIMRSIDRSRDVDARKLLYALSIPQCGADVCKRLLAAYPLDELIAKAIFHESDLFSTQQEPQEVFAHVKGIGPEKSAQFVGWFRNERNLSYYRNLIACLHIKQDADTTQGVRCEGLTFVITGDVQHFKNRNELKAYIESQGGKVASAVSGSTSYLINNDVHSSSGKNKKAHELGIAIISEDDFIKNYGEIE